MKRFKGFRFKKHTGIHQVFIGRIDVKVEDGRMLVNTESRPAEPVQGATHCIGCCMCSFDFEKKVFEPLDEGTEVMA